MVVHAKVYVIEYNARWGDPEAEVIIPGIQNDFFLLGKAIVAKKFSALKITCDKKIRVSVAAAAKGYPTDYTKVKEKEVFGIDTALKIPGVRIFGAGIQKNGEKYVVTGGRILHVVGEGNTVLHAREKAYQALSLLSVEGNNLNYRIDIGYRDVERIRTY